MTYGRRYLRSEKLKYIWFFAYLFVSLHPSYNEQIKSYTNMNINAYEWENSVKIELKEIKSVSKGYLLTGASNYNEANQPFSNITPVSVSVYETRSRYHYEVKFKNKMTEEMTRVVCLSSSKECNPSVVARELMRRSSEL